MPKPILGPGHDLQDRLKGIESVQGSAAATIPPYVESTSGPYVAASWMVLPGGPVAGGIGSAGQVCEWYPVYVPIAVVIQKVTVNVTVAQAGWTGLRLAYYSGSLAGFQLGYEFGTVPVSSTGQKSITLPSITVPKGWMWIAAKLEGSGTTAPTMSRATAYVPPTPVLGSSVPHPDLSVFGHTASVADGPFPATILPGSILNSYPLSVAIQVH